MPVDFSQPDHHSDPIGLQSLLVTLGSHQIEDLPIDFIDATKTRRVLGQPPNGKLTGTASMIHTDLQPVI